MGTEARDSVPSGAPDGPLSHDGAPEVVGPQPASADLDSGDVLVFHTPTPFAAGRVGLRYGFFNAFFCGFRHLFPGIVQIKLGNQVICSELVAESLERAGYDWGKDTALVSPGDLAQELNLPRR